MFKKILFATTASPSCDYAARVAFEIAKRYESELIAFHVLGIPSRGFSQSAQDVRTGETVSYDDDYIQWVEEEIKNTYAKQLADYSKCTIKTVLGVPQTEILRAARKNDVDLIIMGASTQAGDEDDEESYVYRSIVGRTLQSVAKSARCPVLVISRPAASFWGGFSHIVFGTDFSKAADSAFLFSYNLAKALDCKLHIFHALDISSVHTGKLKDQDDIDVFGCQGAEHRGCHPGMIFHTDADHGDLGNIFIAEHSFGTDFCRNLFFNLNSGFIAGSGHSKG